MKNIDDKFNIITSARPKNIGTPKTVQEKYDKLAAKNSNLDLLKETFGLKIEL